MYSFSFPNEKMISAMYIVCEISGRKMSQFLPYHYKLTAAADPAVDTLVLARPKNFF